MAMALGMIKVDRRGVEEIGRIGRLLLAVCHGLGDVEYIRLQVRPVRLQDALGPGHIVGGHDVYHLVALVHVFEKRAAEMQLNVIGMGADRHYFFAHLPFPVLWFVFAECPEY
jgi:hypothetical protein